jgi:hypothetical protein
MESFQWTLDWCKDAWGITGFHGERRGYHLMVPLPEPSIPAHGSAGNGKVGTNCVLAENAHLSRYRPRSASARPCGCSGNMSDSGLP